MLSSGVQTTSGDGVVHAIADQNTALWNFITICNNGSAPGEFSVDGTVWIAFPASGVFQMVFGNTRFSKVDLRRLAGGSDLASCYVTAMDLVQAGTYRAGQVASNP
jgi:hypothetical protein